MLFVCLFNLHWWSELGNWETGEQMGFTRKRENEKTIFGIQTSLIKS